MWPLPRQGPVFLALARGSFVLTGATAEVGKTGLNYTAAIVTERFCSASVPTDSLKRPELIRESSKVPLKRCILRLPHCQGTCLPLEEQEFGAALICEGYRPQSYRERRIQPSEPNTDPCLGLKLVLCLPPKDYGDSSCPNSLFCPQLAHRQLTHTYLPLQGAFAYESFCSKGLDSQVHYLREKLSIRNITFENPCNQPKIIPYKYISQ